MSGAAAAPGAFPPADRSGQKSHVSGRIAIATVTNGTKLDVKTLTFRCYVGCENLPPPPTVGRETQLYSAHR